MGQSLEYPFKAPYSPYEEVPATSSEPEVQLDDVIERIENFRLDENSTPYHPVEQLGPALKGPPNGSQKHLKVFILMKLERQNPKCPQDKMEVM